MVFYLPLVVLAGALGGMVWGGIPGVLKARTGAHEVIVTIMLNAIAARLVDWVVTSRNPALLIDPGASTPRTLDIAPAARLPALIPGTGLSVALLIAIGLCVAMWFVLDRTTTGFEIRMSGLNPHAARYAGISVPRTVVLVMAASGAIAGIGGINVVSGTVGHLTPGLLRNIGFDSIAIALIARGNPLAVIPAALLWGGLLSGAPLMQVQAGLSIDLVRVVQACVILFVAADAIVRTLFRVRDGRDPAASSTTATQGWGV
jgi:general nucleoside transport system permease protein